MMYLVQTYDTKFDFHFEDKDEQTEMMNWVWFTQGGLGPMQGTFHRLLLSVHQALG